MRTTDLLTTEYYVSKLSLAMQNDPLVLAKVRSACEILRNLNSEIDSFKTALNELMNKIINTDDDVSSYQYDDLRDKIAACFNINRKFIIDFVDPLTGNVDTSLKTKFDDFNATVDNNMSTRMHLSNNQLRSVLFCAIMKNSYDGSSEMLKNMYETLFARLIKPDFVNSSNSQINTEGWTICQMTNPSANGSCNTLFVYNDTPPDVTSSDWVDGDSSTGYLKSNWNYFALYFANMLTIHSAGIYYFTDAANIESTLLWADGTSSSYVHDSTVSNSCWDNYDGKELCWL